MYRVVSTSPTFGLYSRDPIDYLRERMCDVEMIPREVSTDEHRLAKAIKGVEAMVVGIEPVTRTVIEAADKLKVIAKHGAGVDNIDLRAAHERGIAVAFAPGANRHAVADLTFGLFLSLARKIPQTFDEVKKGSWPRAVGTEVWGKTLGVVGTGRIGKEVIRRAAGFGMRVLAHDLYPDPQLQERGVVYAPLEDVIREADFLTLHIDLNERSRSLIGAKELAQMKPTAFLVNTARGGIVDESALYDALKNGMIAGAALDVFGQEPPQQSPLLEVPNFIATPHMAGYTKEALREVGMITARNIWNVLQGREPDFRVSVNP